ncbi:MAG: tetratricopeptide repeat protein [Sandaracinaceae bacterium]|nr:tetratricopeptide repeat protein [Sandaracinaceae bacterium]
MDCEACTDRMVELLYGELTDEDAEETQAHLDSCESCGEAYARIQTGQRFASMLDLVEPPVSVLDSVMAAARDRAAGRAPVAEPAPDEIATAPRPDAEDEGGPWAAFLKWIGGFAMRPQLAMAMTLLLMVGLGMWYLPTLRENDPADSHAIVDPAPGDEVGPSASLVPAEPLDLEADPRTGRIRPREEGEPAPRVAVRPTTPPPPPVEPAVVAPEPEATPEEQQQLAMADPAPRPARPTSGQVVEEALPDPRIDGELDVAPGESALRTERPTTQARTMPVPAMAADVQSGQMPSPSPAPVAPSPAQPSGDATARFNQGLQAMREHDYRAASEDFESVIERPGPDTQRLIPAALHNLARSQRSSGNCAAAVRTYERLLQQHPTYSGVGEALIEGGGCYQRLGRLSDARRLYERARSVPSVASQANRLLAVLAQQERGAAREPDPASAAAAE